MTELKSVAAAVYNVDDVETFEAKFDALPDDVKTGDVASATVTVKFFVIALPIDGVALTVKSCVPKGNADAVVTNPAVEMLKLAASSPCNE